MNAGIQRVIKEYLWETLGIEIVFSEWKDSEAMPHAIRSNYRFAEMRILGETVIAVSAIDEKDFSPAKLAKHLAWIDKNHKRMGIFVASGLEAYNRKRLIAHKVPFIIPGNQLYLPDLGLDIREHLLKIREKRKNLSPFAQVVLLAELLGLFPNEIWTATNLAKILRSTKMTMGRAVEDLEDQELIELRAEGRAKQIRFMAQGRNLWDNAQPMLRSPVQKRVYLEHSDFLSWPIAGLSALSELSMIVAPRRKVRAVTSKQWKALRLENKLKEIPEAFADEAAVELEIWRYDPQLLSSSGVVDPLSLYLSLVDTNDERIEAALEDLLNDMQW